MGTADIEQNIRSVSWRQKMCATVKDCWKIPLGIVLLSAFYLVPLFLVFQDKIGTAEIVVQASVVLSTCIGLSSTLRLGTAEARESLLESWSCSRDKTIDADVEYERSKCLLERSVYSILVSTFMLCNQIVISYIWRCDQDAQWTLLYHLTTTITSVLIILQYGALVTVMTGYAISAHVMFTIRAEQVK